MAGALSAAPMWSNTRLMPQSLVWGVLAQTPFLFLVPGDVKQAQAEGSSLRLCLDLSLAHQFLPMSQLTFPGASPRIWVRTAGYAPFFFL